MAAFLSYNVRLATVFCLALHLIRLALQPRRPFLLFRSCGFFGAAP